MGTGGIRLKSSGIGFKLRSQNILADLFKNKHWTLGRFRKGLQILMDGLMNWLTDRLPDWRTPYRFHVSSVLTLPLKYFSQALYNLLNLYGRNVNVIIIIAGSEASIKDSYKTLRPRIIQDLFLDISRDIIILKIPFTQFYNT